jgi:hypothetical protein
MNLDGKAAEILTKLMNDTPEKKEAAAQNQLPVSFSEPEPVRKLH